MAAPHIPEAFHPRALGEGWEMEAQIEQMLKDEMSSI